MKKATDASPNRALKREREQRCWSQLEVADRIGTTAFNVSRWERGITFPGSYFRQQLCAIFEKSPQELGFLSIQEEQAVAVQKGSAEVQTFVLAVEESQAQESEAGLSQPPPVSYADRLIMADETAPLIWNVPYRRNPFFTGREETLQTLQMAFSADNVALSQPLAISGLGGSGKTQTALEYAYRQRHTYQVILWARAETRELLIADFASIAALLILPEKNDQDQSHPVAAVKRWLSRQTGWLLVLDNADDLEMVSDFLPETPGGHLLLTTRAQSTGQIALRIPMEKWSLEDGMLFLLRRAKLFAGSSSPGHILSASWSKARTIAEIMDGLPLALDQAAAYIEETGCGLVGYVERYQRRSMTLLRRRGGLRPEHPESIVATWSLSFEKIEQAHPAAAELLRLCAFLHPDAIAEELLVEGASELTPNLRLLASDPFEMDAAIGTLTTFSLLHRDPDTHILVLHRLVQVVLREQMDEEAQRQWAERAVQVVDRAFPTVSFTTWQGCQQSLPHAMICAELIERLHIALPAALRLLNKTGSYLRERAQYSEAERLLTPTLALSEAMPVADATLLADSLNNLGLLAHDQGKYARSEALLQRALFIYEQEYGPEHIALAQCLSNLAENYRVQTKHGQMEVHIRQALAIREKALGSEHPDVAKSLNQLATLYHGQSKYSQAEPFYQRALAIRQQALGSEHIDVAETLNNLASLYDSLGKYTQAEPLYQQALAFCEKNLGAQHIYTAISLSNLAEVYRALGKYAQAEQLHQRALEILTQTLGATHPHTAKILRLLAEIYLAQGQDVQAETLTLQALEIWEQAVGQEHSYTAMGLDTLARLRRSQGHPIEAEPLARRALAIFQKVWGSDDHVAGSFNTLAEIFYDQQEYSRSEELLQQALQIQDEILGTNHPRTARSLSNLAVLYAAQGRDSQAADYFTRALAIRQQTLPAHHPDLLAVLQQRQDLLNRTENSLQFSSLEEENREAANLGI